MIFVHHLDPVSAAELQERECGAGQEASGNGLTGAGLVRLVGVAAVVAVAAHADGGGLRRGAAVGWALQTQTRTLGGLEGTGWAR